MGFSQMTLRRDTFDWLSVKLGPDRNEEKGCGWKNEDGKLRIAKKRTEENYEK